MALVMGCKKTQKAKENPTKVQRYLLDIHYFLIWYNSVGKSDSIFITNYSRAESSVNSFCKNLFPKTNFPNLNNLANQSFGKLDFYEINYNR